MTDIEFVQKILCKKYGAAYCPSPNQYKVGISLNVRDGIVPINGLRHPPKNDTTGWYIWAGYELFDHSGFFKPLHVAHLTEWAPEILKYLGLPPGWRFLIADEYVDVWYDESLLGI